MSAWFTHPVMYPKNTQQEALVSAEGVTTFRVFYESAPSPRLGERERW
jgi:hypothetical protein